MNPRRRRRRRKKYARARRRVNRRRRTFLMNDPGTRRRRRRRSHRRSYRRYRSNPAPIRSIAGDLGWAAAGFMTTKVVGNMAAPMLAGIGGDQPLIRIAMKLGVAYLSAWGLESFVGRRVFVPAMIGGSLEAIQDAVKTFIAPTFPMLAANYEPLEIYYHYPTAPALPGKLSEYAQLGDGLSPDHDLVV